MSVLENMHISELWKILKENPHLNFIEKSENKENARHIITMLILSTDITHHFHNIELLQKIRSEQA